MRLLLSELVRVHLFQSLVYLDVLVVNGGSEYLKALDVQLYLCLGIQAILFKSFLGFG